MTTLDPIAFGQAAARATLNQDRRPFRVLTGGGEATLRYEQRSHVANLRPSDVQAALAGHPSALPPYDHAADPDRPVLPLLVATSLSVLLRSVDAPGMVDRPNACAAAEVVRRYFLTGAGADDCPPAGIERPVS